MTKVKERNLALNDEVNRARILTFNFTTQVFEVTNK